MSELTKAELIETLNILIGFCRDSEAGFEDAAEETEDATLAARFQRSAETRRRFVAELALEVTERGGEARAEGNTSAALQRVWLNVRERILGHQDKEIVEECLNGEEITLESYHAALQQPLPAMVSELLKKHYLQLEQSYQALEQIAKALGVTRE